MINSNYNNLYYGYLNAAGQNSRTRNTANSKKADSTPVSPRFESLDKALSKGKTRGTTTNMEKIAGTAQRSGSKSEASAMDTESVFARLRDAQMMMYGGGTSTYKNAMGSLLNNMVFGSMTSSKDLFTPNLSTGTLRSALDTVYDTSEVEARIKEYAANGKAATDAAQDGN